MPYFRMDDDETTQTSVVFQVAFQRITGGNRDAANRLLEALHDGGVDLYRRVGPDVEMTDLALMVLPGSGGTSFDPSHKLVVYAYAGEREMRDEMKRLARRFQRKRLHGRLVLEERSDDEKAS